MSHKMKKAISERICADSTTSKEICARGDQFELTPKHWKAENNKISESRSAVNLM